MFAIVLHVSQAILLSFASYSVGQFLRRWSLPIIRSGGVGGAGGTEGAGRQHFGFDLEPEIAMMGLCTAPNPNTNPNTQPCTQPLAGLAPLEAPRTPLRDAFAASRSPIRLAIRQPRGRPACPWTPAVAARAHTVGNPHPPPTWG